MVYYLEIIILVIWTRLLRELKKEKALLFNNIYWKSLLFINHKIIFSKFILLRSASCWHQMHSLHSTITIKTFKKEMTLCSWKYQSRLSSFLCDWKAIMIFACNIIRWTKIWKVKTFWRRTKTNKKLIFFV